MTSAGSNASPAGFSLRRRSSVFVPNVRVFLVALLSACLFLPQGSAVAGPLIKLRLNTAHGLGNARGAVLDAGLSLTSDVSVTPSSPEDGRPFLPPDKLLEDALTVGATILSSSFSGWSFLYDSIWYQKLSDSGRVHVFAYEPRKPQPKNAPPPASFVTVNKIGGLSGDGIEFGVPTTYMHGKGQSTTPSGVTAQLAGLMACLKHLHPDWNWFDIKAALRATAANFSTGYNPRNYGYGAIDYQAAHALGSADTLPLFAPAAVVLPQKGNQITFQINPFKQTRRMTDVLFRFTTQPAVHLKELTLPEITAMGGDLLYSSYLRIPTSNSYSYRPTRNETVYFVWFTMDSRGNYSRIEPYSILGPIRLQGPSPS